MSGVGQALSPACPGPPSLFQQALGGLSGGPLAFEDFFDGDFQNAFELVKGDGGVAGEHGLDVTFDGGFEVEVLGFGGGQASTGLVRFLFAGLIGFLLLLRFKANFGFALFGSEP
jgi:hypothetical protein